MFSYTTPFSRMIISRNRRIDWLNVSVTMYNRYKWKRSRIDVTYLISRCSPITAIRSVSEFGANTNTSPLSYIVLLLAGCEPEKFTRVRRYEGAGYQAPDGLPRDTNHNSIDSATTPKYARPVFSCPLPYPQFSIGNRVSRVGGGSSRGLERNYLPR